MKRRRQRRRRWTAADLKRLRQLYPVLSPRKLECLFNRTISSLYGTAKKLGVSKSAEYLASPEACRLRRGDNVGAPYRFPPGHVPANKGLRRPGWFRGRMRETQFKKGHKNEGHPTRAWVPIGTERINSYGYLDRKITEKGHGAQRWRAVHLLLWEKHRGPVPPGHCVAFKNGDKTDIRLRNLELLTRAERLRRNSIHRFPKELRQVMNLRGAINRQITMRGRREKQAV